MAGLQRSSQTFRRSGSSGLVWDERFGEEQDGRDAEGRTTTEEEFKELRHSRSVGSIGMAQRRRDGRGGGGGGGRGFHTRNVPPALDPPSPKVHGCIFCGIFRKAGRGTEPSKNRRY